MIFQLFNIQNKKRIAIQILNLNLRLLLIWLNKIKFEFILMFRKQMLQNANQI